MELYELIERPELDRPVLVLALDGWIDAGLASATAGAVLLDELDSVTVARFDTDALLDFRVRRPTVHMVDGVLRGLTWPAIELQAATDLAGNELLILTGCEPARSWHRFADTVVHLAQDFEVRLCVGLGAYPAQTPHTRPVRMACSASTIGLADNRFLRASLDYPGGIQSAIEQACDSQDIPAMALWAQVPHYAAAMPYPAAAAQLIETLSEVADLTLPYGELRPQATSTRDRLNELISQNPEHEAMLHRLEADYEQVEASPPMTEVSLPSGEELAAELERFLRDQRDI